MRVALHVGAREARLPLFDLGLADCPYPFLLFLSQADTESILVEHLGARGVDVERGTELVDVDQDTTGVTAGSSAGTATG